MSRCDSSVDTEHSCISICREFEPYCIDEWRIIKFERDQEAHGWFNWPPYITVENGDKPLTKQ